LFEDVLGWCHGREFVCLASMNTMAALIGGFTIHAWGDVPVNDQSGRTQAKVCHGTVDIKRSRLPDSSVVAFQHIAVVFHVVVLNLDVLHFDVLQLAVLHFEVAHVFS